MGVDIANTLPEGNSHAWAWVARTYLFDQFITQEIEQGTDMVVNLASGLDARPYRMSLPSSLKWIEVDLPEIMDYKISVLADEKPTCELQSIRLDLSDRKARTRLFKQLNKECNNALIVSEGLVSYLDEKEAGQLATDLVAEPHFKRWVLDLMSPGLLALAQKEMGSFLEEANAPLK